MDGKPEDTAHPAKVTTESTVGEKKVKVTMPATQASQSIQPTEQIKFAKYEAQGWQFYHSENPMSSESQMDQMSDKVGIDGLPEVFYGSNHLLIANKELNVLLHFNSIDSLSFSGFEKRKSFLNKTTGKDFYVEPTQKPDEKKDQAEGQTENAAATETDDAATKEIVENMQKLILEQSALSEEEKTLNTIDVIPSHVQVAMARFWKNKDKSKIKDYKEYQASSDWTFSTAYKGTTRYLSAYAKQIQDETSLAIDFNKDGSVNTMSLVATPEAAIPFHMLSPENPIKHFGQVYLFETDLEDCGYSMSLVRFRVMADCYYILLRFFLRVDGVAVRIIDTRIFHEFGTDFIHREFQLCESSYDQLRAKEFDLSSEWTLSPQQSDLVFPHLNKKLIHQERILLKK